MGFVIDASVALAWCFEDELSADADDILSRLRRERAIVPAHWPLEVANGLIVAERRGRLSNSKAEEFHSLLSALPVTIDAPVALGSLGIERRIARELSLSAYDAAYVALAGRRSIPLYTLDSALRKAAKRFGIDTGGR